MERVPASAVFGPAEMVYSIYEAGDLDRFANVIEGMQLLEDDYLGGSGSRGSGKVAFEAIRVYTRARGSYTTKTLYREEAFEDLAALTAEQDALIEWLRTEGVPVGGEG
jgi:CRISPR-associated protein Csm3